MLSNKLKHFRRDFNLWSLLTMVIGLLIAIPVLAIVLYLFYGVGDMWGHISAYFLWDYCINSMMLLLGTGFLTFLFGVIPAWIVCNYQFWGRKWLEWLLFLPLSIPSYITAYTYVGVFGNGGTWIGFWQDLGISVERIEFMNIYGLIWVLSCSLFPYVYGGARATFKSYPKSLRDATYLLRGGERRYFFSVGLPLAFPAIVGGLFLVFMEVLNDYGAAKYFGVNTFTTGIFRTWTALEDLQSAIYLSALLVLIVLIINALVQWYKNKRSYTIKQEVSTNGPDLKIVRKRHQFICLALVFIPVLFGFLVPLGQLIYWAILTFESMFTIELFWLSLQSFGVAFLAAFFVLLFGLIMVFFSNWNNLRFIHLFKRIAVIGYVVPGAIIGIGIIRSSQSIIDFFSDNLDLQVGYLFYGSSFVLIYAYVFRFLAVSFNLIEANSLKLGKQLAESSYLLGKSRLKTLLKIELPLLRITLASAFLLVFVDVMKELPLTLILKPYHLNTLAVKAYEYADDERVPEAAWPALILITVIVLLILVFNYVEKRQKNKHE